MQLILFTLLISISSSFATGFKKEDLSLALGLQGTSLLYKRGIVTYGGYQITPLYSLNLFHKDLLLAGSSLYYKLKTTERSHFWFRLNSNSTPDEPLYYTDEEEGERVKRDKTSEFDIIYQHNFAASSYLRLLYSKDLVAHEGNYFEAKLRYNIIDLGNKNLFEIGLFGAVGYGDEKHNEYLYGVGANESGINNIEYGLSLTSTKAIDNLWPTLKFTKFEILGDTNRKASFVDEKNGFNIEVLMAFKVW